MKHAVFLLFLALFSITSLFGATISIKLGSYKNKDALLRQIDRLQPSLKNRIKVFKVNALHKAYALPYATKQEALQSLTEYKKVFADAYITVYDHGEKNLFRPSASISENRTFPVAKKEGVVVPASLQHMQTSLKYIFEGNTFYVCPDKIHTKTEKILIQERFLPNNIWTQKGLMGKVPSLELYYKIDRNKIFFSRNRQIQTLHYSKVDEKLFEYIIVSKLTQNKKLYRMRYYWKEADARAYLESIDF